MIRNAENKDMDAIIDLWQEMMDFHAEISDLYQMRSNAREIYSEYLKGVLINPHCTTLVFESENKILGYVMAMESSDPRVYEGKAGLILEICVGKNHRNKGIGEKLLAEIEKNFREKGIKRIECMASDFNETSKGFWFKHGYNPYNILCVKILP